MFIFSIKNLIFSKTVAIFVLASFLLLSFLCFYSPLSKLVGGDSFSVTSCDLSSSGLMHELSDDGYVLFSVTSFFIFVSVLRRSFFIKKRRIEFISFLNIFIILFNIIFKLNNEFIRALRKGLINRKVYYNLLFFQR